MRHVEVGLATSGYPRREAELPFLPRAFEKSGWVAGKCQTCDWVAARMSCLAFSVLCSRMIRWRLK